MPEESFFRDRGFGSLNFLDQQTLTQALDPQVFPNHNPVLRHRVLRRRQTLEEEEQPRLIMGRLKDLTAEDLEPLHRIIAELSRSEARDPKLAAVDYFIFGSLPDTIEDDWITTIKVLEKKKE